VLVVGRCRRHEDRLRQQALEFVEAERPVVERGRQAKSEVDEIFLACAIALIHSADLRNRHVALVDEHQRARGQVIDERGRRLARLASRQVPGVVLDALAEPDLRHHLEVEARALLDALRLDQLHLRDEVILLCDELALDPFDRVEHLLAPGHIMRRREHRVARHPVPQMSGQRIEELQRLDLVVEERNAHGVLRVFGRKDVEHVAAHAKRAAAEIELGTLVLHLGKPLDRIALREPVALPQMQDHAVIFGRIADAVDRRNGADDDAVGPLEDGLRRRQAHLLDVLVDRAVLLDVQIARRNVRLRLVVVVIRDEIFDGVVREELAEFGVELRRERLVRCEHERRAAASRDHVRHRVRLARAGDAEQRLERQAVGEALGQLFDRFRLVACRLERLMQLVRTIGILDDHGLTIRLANRSF
jgi:hypothetical protein